MAFSTAEYQLRVWKSKDCKGDLSFTNIASEQQCIDLSKYVGGGSYSIKTDKNFSSK